MRNGDTPRRRWCRSLPSVRQRRIENCDRTQGGRVSLIPTADIFQFPNDAGPLRANSLIVAREQPTQADTEAPCRLRVRSLCGVKSPLKSCKRVNSARNECADSSTKRGPLRERGPAGEQNQPKIEKAPGCEGSIFTDVSVYSITKSSPGYS